MRSIGRSNERRSFERAVTKAGSSSRGGTRAKINTRNGMERTIGPGVEKEWKEARDTMHSRTFEKLFASRHSQRAKYRREGCRRTRERRARSLGPRVRARELLPAAH